MTINRMIEERFGLPSDIGNTVAENETLAGILSRRSCRKYSDRAVPADLLETLFATAFSAPSKSDLQQACVIRVEDRAKQRRIAFMKESTRWVAEAPVFLVWCADSRRIRRLAGWRGHDFANDHLDAFMNAAVDAGIAMQTFILAAESASLGCCPVSEIRDHVGLVSDELELPRHVFPLAGLALGWPREEGRISLRLPTSVTVMTDRYDDSDLFEKVADYDRRREALDQTPAEKQRLVKEFGVCSDYGWSENRTRQYSRPARADFGAYIRGQGFNLE